MIEVVDACGVALYLAGLAYWLNLWRLDSEEMDATTTILVIALLLVWPFTIAGLWLAGKFDR